MIFIKTNRLIIFTAIVHAIFISIMYFGYSKPIVFFMASNKAFSFIIDVLMYSAVFLVFLFYIKRSLLLLHPRFPLFLSILICIVSGIILVVFAILSFAANIPSLFINSCFLLARHILLLFLFFLTVRLTLRCLDIRIIFEKSTVFQAVVLFIIIIGVYLLNYAALERGRYHTIVLTMALSSSMSVLSTALMAYWIGKYSKPLVPQQFE